MRTPPPSRRLVYSPSATLLLLLLLLLAGAADAALPLLGIPPQGELTEFFSAARFYPRTHGVASADEAYFAPQVIACRDGSGYFPRNRLNDGYCDCADGTDEPGTSACPEGKFYCKNTGDTPRLLFSSFVNDKICDCCDGSDEYESGIDCQNTCRNVRRLDITNVSTTKHTIDIEDLIQKLRGLRIALVMELGLAICIVAICFVQRCSRTRRRQYILKR